METKKSQIIYNNHNLNSVLRFEIVQSLPGRIRVRINGLKDNRPFGKSIENTLRRHKSIKMVKANSQTGKALIIFNWREASNHEIISLLSTSIYYILKKVSLVDITGLQKSSKPTKKADQIFEPEDIPLQYQIAQVVVSGGILLCLTLKNCLFKKATIAAVPRINLLTTAITLITGYGIFRSGFETLLKKKKLNNDFLIGSATLVSIALKENITALVVVWLVNLSTLFQSFTMEKSRRAIKDMLQGKDETAWVEVDGAVVSIPVENIEVGNIVVCCIGERVAIDGEVIQGEAAVSQAIITGEAIPITKMPGDKIFAGSIVEQGTVKIRVEKAGKDTSIAKIVALVEQASQDRAPIENMADKYADKIVPLSFALAALVYLFTRDFKRSMTMLVVACPCATGLATPTALSAAMGNAARRGILVKGGSYLEKVGNTNVVLFDKTGTLTEGKPSVDEVVPLQKDLSVHGLLQMAASLEYQSNHPLASAVVSKAEQLGLDLMTVENQEVIIGQGVKGIVAEQPLIIGNQKLMINNKISTARAKAKVYRLNMLGQTVLYVAHANKLIGLIGISDQIRPDSIKAIRKLRLAGVEYIGLVTGDNEDIALIVADKLGVDKVWSEMLPADKVKVVEENQKLGNFVTMVGEGINDSPALAKANIGIAMGTGGTDVAIESADIVLASDEPEKIAAIIHLSNHTMEIVRQNFTFAIGANIIGLILGAGKIISPLTAAILHNMSTFGVVVNSSRLFNYDPEVKKGRQLNSGNKRARR